MQQYVKVYIKAYCAYKNYTVRHVVCQVTIHTYICRLPTKFSDAKVLQQRSERGGEQFAVSASLVPVPLKSYFSHTHLHVELWGHLSHVSQYPPHPPLQLNIAHTQYQNMTFLLISIHKTLLVHIINKRSFSAYRRISRQQLQFLPLLCLYCLLSTSPPRPVLCSFH